MLELAVLALMTVFVFVFVIRPLMRTMNREDKPGQVQMIAGPDGRMVAAAGAVAGSGLPAGLLAAPADGPTDTERMIELNQVNGAIQARSLEKVGELASKNPQETVTILRQWLHAPT
jgi:flagellar M-ring protein FliF